MNYEKYYMMVTENVCLYTTGADASVAELADFICAAQMSKAADALLPEEKVPF